ncbi:MAG TPA: ThuA domain-containing protein [Anaerolineales bacterium]
MLSGSEFRFDWIENAYDWSAERMAMYPVTILIKSNNLSSADRTDWMTETVQSAFYDYVYQGNGLLAVHSGTAEYAQKPVLRRLLGGVFTQHPEQCPVMIEPHKGHSLSAGSAVFTVRDEHYFMALDDLRADVFVTTKSEHGEQPGGWRRTEGNGRVVVLTPGHNLEVWLHPSFQTLLLNSLRWCNKLI